MKTLLALALLLSPAWSFAATPTKLTSMKAVTIEGDEVDLIDLKGRPLLIVYGGASVGWCNLCRDMVRWMKKRREPWQGLQVVEITPEENCNMLESKDTSCSQGLVKAANNLEVHWPQWFAKGANLAAALGLNGNTFPQGFVFDAKGNFAGAVIGFGGNTTPMWDEMLKKAMAGYKFPG